uniref:Uncharacterized protein n=1 Tax=Oryza brachyantha TaxID=4533 RepID=J3M5B3_ORYBR
MPSDGKPDSPPPHGPRIPPAAANDEENEDVGPKEEDEPNSGWKQGWRKRKGEAEAGKPAPAAPAVERPSRERKTVERYSELD